jgi:hypothetical protein
MTVLCLPVTTVTEGEAIVTSGQPGPDLSLSHFYGYVEHTI